MTCFRFTLSTSSILKTDIQLFRFVFSRQGAVSFQVLDALVSLRQNNQSHILLGMSKILFICAPGLPRHGAGLSCGYKSRDLLLCTLRCKVSI